MIRDDIHAAIKEALISLGAPEASFVVERPGDFAHGDYATNAALAAAKMLNNPPAGGPKEVAERLKEKLSIEGVEKIEVAGAGFINFFLSREALAKEVYAAAEGEQWGKNDLYADKVVMVEYTDPNPFKEFHIGHLMSNAIGESIARLLEASGAQVLRANYQGDVGPHVAKAMFVLLEQKVEEPTIAQISAAYVEGSKRYEENTDAKTAIDALNKNIYDKSDKQVSALYEKGRAISLEHFEEIYRMLGTKFDLYFFESESGPKGLELVKAHPEVFEQSDGATIFRGENYGLHTRVFVTSQGLPTYEAKDLGLIELKRERATFDTSIVITASEQNDYFKVVLKAAELVFADLAGNLTHRSHGMMRFASGKMSSRKGNVVTGESLLADLTQSSVERMAGRELVNAEKVAEQVAVGAIKYAVLKQGSGKDIVFDPEKSLSLEGDSGPYLQYAHTRALSLVKGAEKAGINPDSTDAPEVPLELERLLAHYPEALERAARELEPHYVTTYLTELAAVFNSWYANNRVIGGAHPSYGLLLAQAAEKTLSKGLAVLGIPAPEEM